MQHDNNIESKLRQLEVVEQPELGHMDAHWRQMAGMLQPVVTPVKNGWPKWMLNSFYGAAVLVLIGAALWLLSTKKADDIKQDEVVLNDTVILENANAVPLDTMQAMIVKDATRAMDTSVTLNTTAINPSLIYDRRYDSEPVQWTQQDSVLGTIKLNVKDCLNCPRKTDSAGAVSNAERQQRLQNLFAKVEKEDQHFTINNSRDTLLQFEEGTVLLVPANSFNGMNGIEITAKEFYKTSDIILNQLSTVSNKEQLETGGMLKLTARYQRNEIKLFKERPVTLFLPETKNDMKNMQLFIGEQQIRQETIPVMQSEQQQGVEKSITPKIINWKSQPQGVIKRKTITQVRVLNIADIPWGVRESSNKKIGYFMYDEDSLAVDKDELKRLLKKKYGYTKVKLTSSIRDRFISVLNFDRDKYDRKYSEHIGDSVWMEKVTADMYKLTGTATRTIVSEEIASISTGGQNKVVVEDMFAALARQSKQQVVDSVDQKGVRDLDYLYSINLSELGWINCDRFYTDSRKKIKFKVDLGDSATNYYTMLVFDKIKSMMTGVIDGNQVAFPNIPLGEPVRIISIGINRKGETVYSVTHTTTSEQELKGVQFQTTSVPDLKASLSKLDN